MRIQPAKRDYQIKLPLKAESRSAQLVLGMLGQKQPFVVTGAHGTHEPPKGTGYAIFWLAEYDAGAINFYGEWVE